MPDQKTSSLWVTGAVIANSSEELWKYQVRIPFRLSRGDAIFLSSRAQVCCAIPLVLCFWNKALPCSVLEKPWCIPRGGARAAPGCCPALGGAPASGAAGLSTAPAAGPESSSRQHIPLGTGHGPGGFPFVR